MVAPAKGPVSTFAAVQVRALLGVNSVSQGKKTHAPHRACLRLVGLHAVVFEGVGFLIHCLGHIQQRHGRQCTGALTQANPDSNQGVLVQCIRQQRARRLRRHMAGQNRLARIRAKAHRQKSCRRTDHSVHKHRNPEGCAAQKCAAHTRNVKAAQLGQHVQRVRRVWLIDLDSPTDGRLFAGKPLVGKTGSPAGDGLRLTAQQHTGHRAGSGGVANAHFTGGQKAHVLLLAVLHQQCTSQNGLLGLLAGHGRAFRNIAGAVGHPPVQHTGLRAKILDAHIHRNQFTIRPPGHSTGVVPSANPQATMAVTSLPVWVTPWATTPLSAQKINRAFLFRSMSTEPVTDAIWHSASSRRPRLPSGFAQAFQRRRVSCSAASFFRLDLFQQLCQCHACSSSRSTPAPAKCANRIPAAYVYVSDQGTKYHRDPDCSGMIDPDRIALEDARSMGFAPCQKCY